MDSVLCLESVFRKAQSNKENTKCNMEYRTVDK